MLVLCEYTPSANKSSFLMAHKGARIATTNGAAIQTYQTYAQHGLNANMCAFVNDCYVLL